MSTTEFFNVTEHTVQACHIREYAGSSQNQEDILHLHVKQYTPKSSTAKGADNAVTILSSPGVGLPKELYEPLWDELYRKTQSSNGFTIRGIWIADAVSLGASGVLNEGKLSNEYCWMDHARDLLLLVNKFRDQMPRPIVGLGHSFGACQLLNLAYLHPRLFTSLIALDPVIQLSYTAMGQDGNPPGLPNYTLHRKDIWPNRVAAAAAQTQASKGWDKRVLDRMIKYGYRDLPTALYPELPPDADPADPPVTLTTSKYYNLLAQLRANFSQKMANGKFFVGKETHADQDPELATLPFCRPEPRKTWLLLPSLRPSTMFVLAGKTYLNLDEMREGIKRTGKGVGGSGGIDEGKVREVILPGQPHMFPFIAVETTANLCFEWLSQSMDQHKRQEERWEAERSSMSPKDHLIVGGKWWELLKPMKEFKESKSKL